MKDLPLKLNWEGYLFLHPVFFSAFFQDVLADGVIFQSLLFIFLYRHTFTIFSDIKLYISISIYIYIHTDICICICTYLWHALEAVHPEILLALSFFVGLI